MAGEDEALWQAAGSLDLAADAVKRGDLRHPQPPEQTLLLASRVEGLAAARRHHTRGSGLPVRLPAQWRDDLGRRRHLCSVFHDADIVAGSIRSRLAFFSTGLPLPAGLAMRRGLVGWPSVHHAWIGSTWFSRPVAARKSHAAGCHFDLVSVMLSGRVIPDGAPPGCTGLEVEPRYRRASGGSTRMPPVCWKTSRTAAQGARPGSHQRPLPWTPSAGVGSGGTHGGWDVRDRPEIRHGGGPQPGP